MERFKTIIAIDDTDEIGYFISTGEICENIAKYIKENYSNTSAITRHQLFLHEDIPYTSHNSSMCFTCDLSFNEFENIKKYIIDYVSNISAPSSSGGVAMVFEKDINDTKKLINYGFDAKNKVLNKDIAYNLAKEQNIFLKEIKNEGNGIIGALAGIALRLSGNDGRLRGKVKLKAQELNAKELLEDKLIDEIKLPNNQELDLSKKIFFDDSSLKWILKNNKKTLLIKDSNEFYLPLNKEELAIY
ncbi:hypothetical protein [Arcobacter porcinus]|uniref:hypothetical protein n=1 Tax=Arcobacter porcinus TaxID=1935204 RepID=UPI00081D9061|nr:hypothetical protein [Arcobacter porcinus]OCL84265.1 hypothetical protein AAW30_00639 [Arcobacter porcinus]OCL84785.1 hypothetical protein AAW29_00464 [Arcobacter porcinus]